MSIRSIVAWFVWIVSMLYSILGSQFSNKYLLTYLLTPTLTGRIAFSVQRSDRCAGRFRASPSWVPYSVSEAPTTYWKLQHHLYTGRSLQQSTADWTGPKFEEWTRPVPDMIEERGEATMALALSWWPHNWAEICSVFYAVRRCRQRGVHVMLQLLHSAQHRPTASRLRLLI